MSGGTGGLSSVLPLLSTDSIPDSSSSGEERPPPPPPSLLPTIVPAYLDTINEEESDDLRSISSTSFNSPSTVIHKSQEQLNRSNLSVASSRFSDSDYKSPLAASPQPHTVEKGSDVPSLNSSSDELEVTVVDQETQTKTDSDSPGTTLEHTKGKSEDKTKGLLKELAKLGQSGSSSQIHQEDSSSTSDTRPLAEANLTDTGATESSTGEEFAFMDEFQHQDRDQTEELVYNDERRKTITMDDTSSLRSVSIPLDETRDSILNTSVPHDDISIMETSLISRPSQRPPSPPLDLPPPPPPSQTPPSHTAHRPAPPPPPPPPPAPIYRPDEDDDLPPETAPPPPPVSYQTSKSSFVSTSSPVPPAPPSQELKPRSPLTATSTSSFTPVSTSVYRNEIYHEAPETIKEFRSETLRSPENNTEEKSSSSHQIPSHIMAGIRKTFENDRSEQGMSSPPVEPPLAYSKSGFSSREDLLSDHPPSRSTIREIPVQRAPSAAPTQSTALEIRMPSSYQPAGGDVQDEYYRREVMTRTVVTRSNEAISQQPLGRSSPIERYVSYPDPNTREERTVDYKVTIHRNIEDEERRIREDQDRRKQEEEDRRRREEERQRQWETKEREVLERLRRERERKEKESEMSILERERLEKERIEKDRLDRQRLELQRRAEWDRLEDERRNLEESDLARRRQIEFERLEKQRIEEERRERERLEREREILERQRLEEERREQERLEKLRIERERIERERIEIERIERIKREKFEREKKERERQKEEEDRLRREREELERLERERRELEIREREALEQARKEAEQRERQRLEDEAREARRREEERREVELLNDIQRQAEERERQRRAEEKEEHDRLERIRREQMRIDMEKADAERRERERMEEERREQELIDAQRRAKQQRERERIEDIEREKLRQEEERKEKERREAERIAATERERHRRAEEERERLRLLELERAQAQRRAQRTAEQDRQKERDDLDRRARELSEMERRENERRERERIEEERSLLELREKERRNQEIRDKERQEAAEREAARRVDDRRSRDKLDMLIREKTEKERFESEKRRLFAEKEALNRKRNELTSSETLAKLTRPAYFSRENLANTEVTTKVERQVIERVDRNVWVDDMRYPSSQQAISYSLDSTNDENQRDRLYNPNDLGRAGSTRTSRYRDRARLEKARRDFLSGAPDSAGYGADYDYRFNRSTDDLDARPRQELRGPLLQKFHESEFKSYNSQEPQPYPRVAPSDAGKEFERLLEETERKYAAYRLRNSQPNLYSRPRTYSHNFLETDVDTGTPDYRGNIREVEETNLDDVHGRSGSVVDYERMSRKEYQEENSHTRSRSADYLMDRRLREETAPPENELRKTAEASPRASQMSEHELRFRKSTERLTVPEWYRENRPTVRPTDVDSTLPRTRHWESTTNYRSEQPFSYTQPMGGQTTSGRTPTTPSGGIDFPRGMFDKYRDEVEEFRRSRTSLHQLGQESINQPQRQEVRPSPAPRTSLSLSQEAITQTETKHEQHIQPGYTVTEVPSNWNFTPSASARVVEVADTFVPPRQTSRQGNVSLRYGGRVTVEEVLDQIFQQTPPSSTTRQDTSLPLADNLYQGNLDGPGIYSQNYMLMDMVLKQPERAEDLLKSEALFVRCSQCHRTRELGLARYQFVSCKHCYTYYCSRECRENDWPRHSQRCSFARINTLCKDVIMKVREDSLAQSYMSKLAREGFSKEGRGSVNLRLPSPQLAQAYTTHGWQALSGIQPNQLLFFYTVENLIQERKEPSLVALCRRYDPTEKFILSVSIIADIENCPQTPPPETVHLTLPSPSMTNRAPVPDNRASQSPLDHRINSRQHHTLPSYSLIPTDV